MNQLTPTTDSGVYSSFHLTETGANNLYEFVSGIMPEGTELQSADQYHVTTIYSKKYVEHVPASPEAFSAIGVGYEYLGREGDDPVIVLRVEHHKFYEQHGAALALGAQHDFDEYLPHITLTKKIPGRVINIEGLPLPHWAIPIGPETVETLKEHVENDISS